MAGRPLAGALLALSLALSGCGFGGDDDESSSSGPREVRTTDVKVVQSPGAKTEGLDAEGLYKQVAPGVVTIISLFGDGQRGLLDEGGEGGQGSGFVLDDEGYVATNAHVVTSGRGPRRKNAKQVFVEFSDGNRVEAKVIGADPNADVGLVKVDPAGLSLTPLPLGELSTLRVGAPVAAIGSPFGENQSLTIGVISAVDRTIESLTDFQIGNAIQTDAAINPGNSGGPLLNARGQVVGINAQIKSRSGGGEGVGFAIPIDAVRRSLEELRDGGRVSYGYLGVESLPLYPQLAKRLGLSGRDGALIIRVTGDSPADDAGLKAGGDKIRFQGARDIPTEADVIVAVNGRKVTRTQDLADLISNHSEGDKVKLEVARNGDRREVEVELGRRPASVPD